MITFSAEFPLAKTKDVSDVLALARQWVLGSPFTKLSEENIRADTSSGEEYLFSSGPEQVVLAHVEQEKYRIGGFRYTRVEDDKIEWVTTIVATKEEENLLMSLQISCEALNTITRLPKPNKPYFIKQVLEHVGGGVDGEIPVTDRAFFLTDKESAVAAELISGRGGNTLPLVYVSARYDGTYAVSPTELAKWVAGLAHVVVEPSRSFSARLKNLVDARNVYGGSIGVYWPASYARKAYFLSDATPDPKHLQMLIARDIRTALANRRQTSRCTWLHLKEVLSREHLERVKKSGSSETQEFIDAFDAELKAKDERLVEANREIARLNAELSRHGGRETQAAGELIVLGNEQDFFPGEIKDIAIAALENYAGSSLAGTRRSHVLDDLLQHNKKSGTQDAIDSELKAIFRSYVEMDAKTRGRLTKLGFDITEEGKHYKAVFQGDGRYTFIISKTSSDHRAGKNLASDIIKTLL